jgi:4-amino-4-deoxy-L-arabinose transferase-like glycosyltransferase
MSRVFHWIQNHNVNHYPTHILRQLIYTPGAEFVIMHFQILSGTDRLANLLQWFCMLGSIIGVSLIAKQFGADIHGQVFSAVVCATIPMGILQGSSTLTDYVTSFWIVCFVYYLTLLKRQPKRNYSLLTGASLGLALLTKGSAYVGAFLFLAWFIFLSFKRIRWQLWKLILIIAIIALFINLGYYMRNIDLSGSTPLDFADFRLFPNDAISVPLFISNIVREIGLHLGTPLRSVNLATYKIIKLIHTTLGVDINDPRITYPPFRFFIVFSSHELCTGNFIHLILFIVSITIFLISSQRKKQPVLICYLASLVIAFFISYYFFKWELFNSHYHLPLFVLSSPFIATVLSRINNPFKQNKILLIFISMVFLCLLAGWLLYHYFGLKLVKALYDPNLIGLLNTKLARQFAHLEPTFYFEGTGSMFRWFLGIYICLLFGLFCLYPSKKITGSIGLILILASLPWVFHNETRKLIGKENIFAVSRIDQYFYDNRSLRDPYIGAVDYIKSKKCSNIGIILDDYLFGSRDWEYPFVVLLEKSNVRAFRLEHVNVNNISSVKYSVYPFSGFEPCAIISLKSAQDDKIINKKAIYVKEWASGPVSVFIRR